MWLASLNRNGGHMRLSDQTLYRAHRWSTVVDRVNQLSGLVGDARLDEEEVYYLVCEVLENESRRIAQQTNYVWGKDDHSR